MKHALLSFMLFTSLVSFSQTFVLPDTVNPTPREEKRNELIKATKIIMEENAREAVGSDSIYSLFNQFYYDQFRHSQDPDIPSFMFMSKDANFTMGIGGVVRLRGCYDWHDPMPERSFSPYLIPVLSDPSYKHRLDGSPQGTTLYFTVIGRNHIFRHIMAYIEAKFNGGSSGIAFKLGKVYVTLDDWTLGYTTSTFIDPAADPPAVDGAGPNGSLSKKNLLVRYVHSFRNHWVVGAGVEIPTTAVNADNVNTKKCPPYLPDLAGFGQFQWNNGRSHVRLSGLVRCLPYRDLLVSKNYNITGWGVQLSSVINVIRSLNLYMVAATGQGNGSYVNDLCVDNTELLPLPGNAGKLYAPKALGLTFGAEYFFRRNLYSTVTLSRLRYFTKAGAPEDTFKYGIMARANLFWEITNRLQTGVEYQIAKKKVVSDASGVAERVNVFFQFAF